TRAPCSSSGVRPLTYWTGVAAAVHASIFGDHGTVTPSPASVATATTITNTARTATGRRFQLFSPVPATKGTRKSAAIASTGPTRITKVSVQGGSKANRA